MQFMGNGEGVSLFKGTLLCSWRRLCLVPASWRGASCLLTARPSPRLTLYSLMASGAEGMGRVKSRPQSVLSLLVWGWKDRQQGWGRRWVWLVHVGL